MKKITAFSILLNIALIGCIILIYRQPKCHHTKTTNAPVKNIAIFTPTTHPSLQAIEQGFIETLKKNKEYNYEFTIFNANGNRTLMRAQADEIIHSNYDLIFTIAAQPTQMIKEISEKKKCTIPIVFGAVANPKALNLIKTYKSSGNHITGVTEDRNLSQQLDILLYIKPNIKNVTLVYNPSEGSGLEGQKKEIKSYLTQKNIQLNSLEVYISNEIYQKVATAVRDSDVIMVLKDNTVVSAIDSLIKLCNQHGTLLYASDLDSVDKGAAAAFGVHEYEYGVSGAQKALSILIKHKKPSAITITRAENFKLKINTKTMNLQGLHLNASQLFLMRAGELT